MSSNKLRISRGPTVYTLSPFPASGKLIAPQPLAGERKGLAAPVHWEPSQVLPVPSLSAQWEQALRKS